MPPCLMMKSCLISECITTEIQVSASKAVNGYAIEITFTEDLPATAVIVTIKSQSNNWAESVAWSNSTEFRSGYSTYKFSQEILLSEENVIITLFSYQNSTWIMYKPSTIYLGKHKECSH